MTGSPSMALTGPEIAALTYEVDAIARLIAHGTQILRHSTYTRGTAPVFFACLASGAERLLKTTFGLLEREETGSWPSASAMKTLHSHKIYDMDVSVRARLDQRVGGTPDQASVTELLRLVEDDITLRVLLGALQREAAGSRFYNLDILAAAPQSLPSAVDGWTRFENILAKADDTIAHDLASVDNQLRGQYRLNNKVAESIDQWRRLYFEVWSSGTIGSEAKLFYPHMEMAWNNAHERPILTGLGETPIPSLPETTPESPPAKSPEAPDSRPTTLFKASHADG